MSEINSVLLELHYLPGTAYFSSIAKHPVFFLEQNEHYGKGSYRNRAEIATANGLLRLSIPLRKGKNNLPVREVRIAYDEPWQARHWQALLSAYGKSPFFLHYVDEFFPFYKTKKYEWLWDWNYDLLELLLRLLRLDSRLLLTESFDKKPASNIWDLRDSFRPGLPLSLPEVSVPVYSQVFEDRLGFLSNLSVVDLLFCAGPAASDYLKFSR